MGTTGTTRHATVIGMRILDGAGAFQRPDGDESTHFVEHLRRPDMSVDTYSIPAGAVDDQSPHTEDEIYVVTAGRARIVTPGGGADVRPGDVIFVPAGVDHHFADITEDLALIVVFAPAYRSRA
jgi:mannose-6-phosphate isomerase-like protein (cupin superfamily)